MRLSTAHAFDASIESLVQRQARLSQSQLQLTTGRAVNRASDDPAAAARAERALASEARSRSMQRAVEASRSAMSVAESTLGDAGELMQQARELMVAAGNATLGDAGRASIGERLRDLRAQLLMLANQGNSAQGFVFAGQGVSEAPFLDAATGVQFTGTEGASVGDSGEPLALSLDGNAVWLRAQSGNGVFETTATLSNGSAWIDAGQVSDPQALTGSSYDIVFDVTAGVTTYAVLQGGAPTAVTAAAFTPGQQIVVDGQAVRIAGQPADGDRFGLAPATPDLDIFSVLDAAASALQTPAQPAARVAQSVAFGLRDIDAAMAGIGSARAQAGALLARIDAVSGRLQDTELHAHTARSAAQDLDMVRAISDFQNQQTGYEAALKSHAMLRQQSLLQYLNF